MAVREVQQMSADFLVAIIEHVAHPIFVKNREFRFVLVNRALCEMVGYPREAMLGKTDYDFFPAHEADFFRAKDEAAFAAGETVTIEREPITDAQGRVHMLATSKVPLRSQGGRLDFLVGIIHDITKLHDAEEALRKAHERLELRVAERTAELRHAEEALMRRERLAMLGQLAGGLAHQLRNPLGAIANAAALCSKGPLSDGQKSALEVVHEEVRRADRTISDLLDYARVRPPERREVTLAAIVDGALGQERIARGVLLDVHVDPETTAFVDPVQVEAAVANVIRNALEAMPDGGSLTILGERRGEHAVVVVRDSGAGVSAEVVGSLFVPLVTTKAQGVGLGLSTARNLVENQGGSLRYTAAPERRGAEFTVELPTSAAG